MQFSDILSSFRGSSITERNKGARFERLIAAWFKSDPRFASQIAQVWLWADFPARNDISAKDVGIDLVAKTRDGDYWAVQCKCYGENAYIDKGELDSFLAASSARFRDTDTGELAQFALRYWVSTSANWSATAEDTIRNQIIPVQRITPEDLENSSVDWEKLLAGTEGRDALKAGKKPMEHQLKAVEKAATYYKDHERGKLIMACGTGKTYTSLLIAEELLGGGGNAHGLVLFLVPSIALLGQSLNAWFTDAREDLNAVCICSDAKASQKISRDADIIQSNPVDLAYPASTNADTVKKQLLHFRTKGGLTVVFSTYQSIDAVSEAQGAVLKATGGEYGVFDLIICDEAHRTTGVALTDKGESNFIKVHKNDIIQGKKRLYMTATPRIYLPNAKIKAKESDKVDYLCSMDDEKLYGEEFFTVPFSYAVEHGLLTDYKVLVLTVNETDLPGSVVDAIKDGSITEVSANYSDSTKLVGVINGLSKLIRGDDGKTWSADPVLMRRAVAFCTKIGTDGKPETGTSKNTAAILPEISRRVYEAVVPEQKDHIVQVSARHIDGSMNSQERNQILSWLREESDNPAECKVVCNVRCLSEGVDVPSLDAVLFLSARNSQVDVVQSVRRVMRNFRKGEPGEKKYGYIIIPVVVPEHVSPEDALNKNDYYDVVWSILNSLRSHDDRFTAKVETFNLNGRRDTDDTNVVISRAGIGYGEKNIDGETGADGVQLSRDDVVRQLELQFGEMKSEIYAKLVEKCGDRLYWENWAKEVGVIARAFIERITRLVAGGSHKEAFDAYLESLQKNINPSVDAAQAIEMLAQHTITRPVFDALFSNYEFVRHNPVSRSMETMLAALQEEAFEKDTEVLQSFYESVRLTVGGIKNLEGKQTVIKNLYEKFFKGAFPKTVEKLGIVYTPVECVDFIIHSVDDILRAEFGTSLTAPNVHILDPFTGTGTFITRLLQSGLIRPEDMERKYREEIHCNEIVLLAYYIADVNIEAVFHDVTKCDEYLPYDGICLTDTFQLAESRNALFSEVFQENSERVNRQRNTPVRVIVGNPPYSAKQESANDNNQNLKYEKLDGRLAETYVAGTNATNKNSLYDPYIRAFRWASDRIPKDEGGVIGFISNGAWLDGNANDGMRQCLEKEFSSIYVFNLRGNQRTSGELSRKEGGKIFDSGSRTPIAITLLVKNPATKTERAKIYYHDIGDYLDRQKKLSIIRDFVSIGNKTMNWSVITPNEKNDWLNQRDGVFDSLVLLGDKDDKTNEKTCFYPIYSRGLATARDSWCYCFSKKQLEKQLKFSIAFYNEQRVLYAKEKILNKNITAKEFVQYDTSKLSWNRGILNYCEKNKPIDFSNSSMRISLYRPFCKQNGYFNVAMNDMTYQLDKLFPITDCVNLVICVSGAGGTKEKSAFITNVIPDLNVLDSGTQCFPLYWYEENKSAVPSLFGESVVEPVETTSGTVISTGSMTASNKYIRHDGITDWILAEVRRRYGNARAVTKEHIFYYVYGILHSPQYRERFAADLKKSLPRIPIADSLDDFMAFSTAGKRLADLHLNYERVPVCKEVQVEAIKPVTYRIPQEENALMVADSACHAERNDRHSELVSAAQGKTPKQVRGDGEKVTAIPNASFSQKNSKNKSQDLFAYYAVEKMTFAKTRGEQGKPVADKSTIFYNHYITLKNILATAYAYVVNGKSAVEWLMERYAVTCDKDSLIKNDPNDWSREHEKPRYVLDLLLSVITVSVQTAEIVAGLPQVEMG